MNIKYILLLTLVCFCYPLKHCLQSMKVCNKIKISISHCTLVLGNQCLECEENYSPSNDRSECINVANCRWFLEDGKCGNCEFYHNFDTNGNCVIDSCLFYDENRKCIQCYPGYTLNNDRQCEKINIKNCALLKEDNNNECEECFGFYELENGVCKLENNNYIEGCEIENADGTCEECNQYYNLNNGKCTFKNECKESDIYEMCFLCEDGYYLSDISYHCYSIDGTKDTDESGTDSDDSKSNGININFALIYLFLALI